MSDGGQLELFDNPETVTPGNGLKAAAKVVPSGNHSDIAIAPPGYWLNPATREVRKATWQELREAGRLLAKHADIAGRKHRNRCDVRRRAA